MPVYFIAGELISSESPVYTTDTLADGLKYTFFSLAALELCRYLNWAPDILHANDWHTAPAVYSLSVDRKEEPFFSDTASVLGVHNLPYLGPGRGDRPGLLRAAAGRFEEPAGLGAPAAAAAWSADGRPHRGGLAQLRPGDPDA